LKLGGISIGYVIATSEPADSQVSILSLLTFTKDRSHPYSLTLTKGKYLPFSPVKANLETGNFSIGYVIATPEPTDSQDSLSNPAKTMFSSRTRLEIRQKSKQKKEFSLNSKRMEYMEAHIQ